MGQKIRTCFQEHVNKTAFDQSFRLAFAILLSVWIADLLKVRFAPSTGVIALLTLQGSKGETWHTVVQKLISYIYTMGITWMVSRYMGVNTAAFSMVILLVVLISVLLKWNSTLSVNVVILLHLFLQAAEINQTIWINETERLAIGIGTAVFVRYISLPRSSRGKHSSEAGEKTE